MILSANWNATLEASKKCLLFLDLKAKVVNDKLEIDLYIKPTGCYQYLHYLSSYPEYAKYFITYSQALRINRLCSLEKSFNYHKLNMKE